MQFAVSTQKPVANQALNHSDIYKRVIYVVCHRYNEVYLHGSSLDCEAGSLEHRLRELIMQLLFRGVGREVEAVEARVGFR